MLIIDIIAGCCVAQTASRGPLGGSPKPEVKARLGEVRVCRADARADVAAQLAPPCGNWRVVTDLWPTLNFILHDFGGPIVFG